jgi:hypothetical protein
MEEAMTWIDPGTVNWALETDSEVWHAAQAGHPGAVQECKRRGLDEPMPKPHTGGPYAVGQQQP